MSTHPISLAYRPDPAPRRAWPADAGYNKSNRPAPFSSVMRQTAGGCPPRGASLASPPPGTGTTSRHQSAAAGAQPPTAWRDPGTAPVPDGPAAGGPEAAPEPEPGRNDFFGSDGFTGEDMLDIINPLHHLPLIGMLYREISGDTISPGARIVGGGLLGGPIGFVSGMVNVGIEKGTGRSVGQHLKSAAGFGEDVEASPGRASPGRAEQAARAYAAGSRTMHPMDRQDGPVAPPRGQAASLDRAPGTAQRDRDDKGSGLSVARSLAEPASGYGPVDHREARPAVRYVWETGPAGLSQGRPAARGSDIG